jgi:N-acetylglucosamine-6-phosphate deacetylase
MHLEGPWLSTTGKQKGRKKFASAEHKRKAEQADADWKELQRRWGVEAEE